MYSEIIILVGKKSSENVSQVTSASHLPRNVFVVYHVQRPGLPLGKFYEKLGDGRAKIETADLKATTIKEALARWQENNQTPLAEALYVGLQFQWPPIEKMDANLGVLKNCEKLSLSTNCIEKITSLDALKNLRILSLARNNIKSFAGIEKLADTLEELWISYNYIEKLKGIMGMKKLKVLYIGNNMIDSWNEVQKLLKLETLQELVLTGNPIQESMEEAVWRTECVKRLTQISILDGIPIIRE